jgi:hypothetical protein
MKNPSVPKRDAVMIWMPCSKMRKYLMDAIHQISFVAVLVGVRVRIGYEVRTDHTLNAGGAGWGMPTLMETWRSDPVMVGTCGLSRRI